MCIYIEVCVVRKNFREIGEDFGFFIVKFKVFVLEIKLRMIIGNLSM